MPKQLNVERSTSTAHRLSHYDGACGNIHGHNMLWEVEVRVRMDEDDPSNMPLDLKEIADAIDEVDHACLLNKDDSLCEPSSMGVSAVEQMFGDVIWFEGDPTCEVLSEWMAEQLYNLDPAVTNVSVTLSETDKYSVTEHYSAISSGEEPDRNSGDEEEEATIEEDEEATDE